VKVVKAAGISHERIVQTRLLGWISRTLEKLNDNERRVSIALELQH
jgi:hypothetical protein